MTKVLPIGQWGVLERTVTQDLTAGALGSSGMDVLATPVLIEFVERASGQLVRPYLAEGEATVGTRVELNHLAATPVGMKVTVRSQLAAVDGRKLTFKFEAFDEVEKIAEGTHIRAIVSLQKILEKARAKKVG